MLVFIEYLDCPPGHMPEGCKHLVASDPLGWRMLNPTIMSGFLLQRNNARIGCHGGALAGFPVSVPRDKSASAIQKPMRSVPVTRGSQAVGEAVFSTRT